MPSRLRRPSLLLALILVAALAAPASAADNVAGPFLADQPPLSGNWFGFRDTLAEWGITSDIRYATNVQASVLGGRRTGQAYAGQFGVDVSVDLQKLAGVPGLTFDVAGDWGSGTNLSDDIGNFFPVAQFFEGRKLRLYNLYLEQSLFDGRLDLKVGRFSTGADFLTAPAGVSLVNEALNPIVLAIQANVPGVTAEPNATWGSRVLGRPTESLSLSLGAFYSDPTIDQLTADGTEFGIDTGAGGFFIGELAYLVNYAKGATGLPGRYRAGAYYDTNRYASLRDPAREERGNYGLFLAGEQMVYREGDVESEQGLSVFAAFVYAPLERINTVPYFASAGVSYRGLLPGRDADSAAFALYYGGFSRDLPDRTYELILEWTYAVAFSRRVSLQPDIQYVINPGGRAKVDNALVVGVQLWIEF